MNICELVRLCSLKIESRTDNLAKTTRQGGFLRNCKKVKNFLIVHGTRHSDDGLWDILLPFVFNRRPFRSSASR